MKKRKQPILSLATFFFSFVVNESESWAFLWRASSDVFKNKRCQSFLPLRSQSLPVLVEDEAKEKDLVRAQLGYVPTNFVRISAWTGNSNLPVAIQTYPLDGGAVRRRAKAERGFQQDEERDDHPGTPFPTLYWLCNSSISKAVAELERLGYVAFLEESIQSDPQLVRDWLKCHEEYARLRWNGLSASHRERLENEMSPSIQRMREMLQYSGVSGTNFTAYLNEAKPENSVDCEQNSSNLTNIPSIKCLHAHYAHFRSIEHLLREKQQNSPSITVVNPVGKMVHELLKEKFPLLDL